MLKNPYSEINWGSTGRLQSNTHNHLFYQWHIDNMYANGGRFVGAHPHYGKPLYPMSDYGMTLPSDAIEYSLAEHYGNNDMAHPNHFCAVGSTLVTDEAEPHAGFQGSAFEFLDAVRNTLQVPDGGGVHWNHPGATFPTETNSNLVWIKKMYDYAPDIFLGVEFYNNSQGKTYEGQNPFMEGWWDALLRSGRHVWGFANPDYEARRLDPYPDWEGKQILLIPEATREACLRAIRKGQFFNVLYNTGFYFSKISDEENTVKIELNQVGNIKFKTATREVDFKDVSQAELTLDKTDIYARVIAEQGDEKIYSQALMYIQETKPDRRRLVTNRAILI